MKERLGCDGDGRTIEARMEEEKEKDENLRGKELEGQKSGVVVVVASC